MAAISEAACLRGRRRDSRRIASMAVRRVTRCSHATNGVPGWMRAASWAKSKKTDWATSSGGLERAYLPAGGGVNEVEMSSHELGEGGLRPIADVTLEEVVVAHVLPVIAAVR